MRMLGSWRSPALVMGGLWLVLVTAWPLPASAQNPEGETALLLFLGLAASDPRNAQVAQERVRGVEHRRPAISRVRTGVAGAPKVNLNTATQEELETLSGIGPATAKRIIANRPYASVAELSRARVAGPIIERISPHVVVVGPRAGAPPHR